MSSQIVMRNRELEVAIDADRGAAVTAVVHRPTGIHWLREAPDHATRVAHPFVYGMPPLFPPGRIANGTFRLGSKLFHWPLNDHAGPATLHGFGWDQPWRVLHQSTDNVVLALDNKAAIEGFGAQFLLQMGYRIEGTILHMVGELTNRDDIPIPAALGFHTDISLDTSDWLIQLPTLQPWELDQNLVPTGKLGRLLPPQSRTASKILEDQPYRLQDGEAHHIVLTMTDGPLIVHMQGDTNFQQLVLYRPARDANFFSVEPYSWVSNAPNLSLSDSLTGLIRLNPGAKKRWHYHVSFDT